MTELKKPNFEEAPGVFTIKDIAQPKTIWVGNFDVGTSVSVKYKGKQVHMIVTELLSETEAVGKIKGFETITTEFEDLVLYEEVVFKKKHVWGIRK